MLGDRGHMRAMQLLPFAAAADEVCTAWTDVHRLLSAVRGMYVRHKK
jgi:hypothetical protein